MSPERDSRAAYAWLVRAAPHQKPEKKQKKQRKDGEVVAYVVTCCCCCPFSPVPTAGINRRNPQHDNNMSLVYY